MVAIPPKHRSFIKTANGLKAKTIPSPEGFSLVTSHVYTKLVLFYENTTNDPVFYNWQKFKDNITQALEHYYPFTGRLAKKENGRYDITNFDKGALFVVGDSADSFQDWKRSNYSYSEVPYEELIPIHNYVSRDSALFGCKMTFTRDNGLAVSYSFHHKVADGLCLTQFIHLLGRIGRGVHIPENEIFLYTERDRQPIKPLPGVDHNNHYPTCPPKNRPLPTVPMGPSKKVIFCINKEKRDQLKKDVLTEAGSTQQNAKISQLSVVSALINKSIVKARKFPADSCADILNIVGIHQKSPDKNMVKYFGNYVMPTIIPNSAQQVLDKSILQVANEIRQKADEVTASYVESLEYYFNNHKNVEDVMSPVARVMYGAIGMSDWSKFTDNYDFGIGSHVCLRSYVDPSPLPLITFMPYINGTMEVIVQLDCESMDRLIRDPDFMKYISSYS